MVNYPNCETTREISLRLQRESTKCETFRQLVIGSNHVSMFAWEKLRYLGADQVAWVVWPASPGWGFNNRAKTDRALWGVYEGCGEADQGCSADNPCTMA